MTGDLQTRVVDLRHKTVETGLAARGGDAVIIFLTRGGIDGIIWLINPAGLAAKTIAVEDLDAIDPQEVPMHARDLPRQHLVEVIDADIEIKPHRKAFCD